MYILHGKIISSGKGAGFLHSIDSFDYHPDKLHHDNCEKELERFQKARADSLNQLQSIYEHALLKIKEEEAKIFVIQQMMIHDNEYTTAVQQMIKKGYTADYAVWTVAKEDIEKIEALDDEYMRARADDVRDIARRIINNMSESKAQPEAAHKNRRIVAYAKKIVPSDIIEMMQQNVSAFISFSASEVSHSSILARALGIPYITSVSEDISEFEDKRVTVDADNNTITIITSNNAVTV